MAHSLSDVRQEPRELDRLEEDEGRDGRGLGLSILIGSAFWIVAGVIFALWWA